MNFKRQYGQRPSTKQLRHKKYTVQLNNEFLEIFEALLHICVTAKTYRTFQALPERYCFTKYALQKLQKV